MSDQITKNRQSDIFISYRRSDSAWAAGRIQDFLKIHFKSGSIFRDVEQIGLGQKFPERIQQALESCKIMLVIIGSSWLTIADEYGRRRLDNPEDWVRIEVETALRREILVIPVVLEGAKLPTKIALPDSLKNLIDLNGILNLQDQYFIYQMGNLLDTIKTVVEASSDGQYPHIDELKVMVRESLIDSDDPELIRHMKDYLYEDFVKEYQDDMWSNGGDGDDD